jgi:signal transduction histidine kinase
VLIDEKAGPLNATQKDYLTDMLHSGHHLLQLINDVLDLAKIEAGKMTLVPERFLLEGAVAEVAAGLEPLAREKQLAIGQEVSPAVAHAHLDKQRFKQILYNLLSNAVKFTNPGGRVTVAVSRRENQAIELKVQDTGIGIRPEDVGRLFVAFQQLDASAARAYPGTGLGLALTRKMAELHGGTVRVESRPGHGSTFTVLLPQQLPAEKRE